MKIATLAVIGVCLLPGNALAGAPEGVWMSEDGGTKACISTCQANKLCGTVAWLARPIDPETGKPKTDKLNPDPGKRARPLIGLQVCLCLGAERSEHLDRTDLQR